MGYSIDKNKCLKCGLCVNKCPEKAIVIDETIEEDDGLVLYITGIDEEKCTECGTCVSLEWWCPAKAISSS